MLKGSTAQFLIERCAKVERGQTVLVHAAAGGVGQLLAGWLNAIGAVVIGTVGSPAKAERARKAGAAHVIDRRRENVVAPVHEITGGQRCPVIFCGLGRATREKYDE